MIARKQWYQRRVRGIHPQPNCWQMVEYICTVMTPESQRIVIGKMGGELNAPTMDANTTTTARKRKLETEYCPNIGVLPGEILVQIFSRLGTEDVVDTSDYFYFDNLVRVSLVCKQWNNLTQESSLWEKYCLHLDESKFPEDVKKLVDQKYSKIEYLHFSNKKGKVSPHLSHVFFGSQGCSQCSAMVSQFSASERFNLDQISQRLSRLAFDNNYILEEEVFQAICSLPKVKELDIFSTSFEPKECLRHITNLTSLEGLGFDFKGNQDDVLLSIIWEGGLANLKRFDFLNPRDQDLSFLSKMPKLENLSVSSPIEVNQFFAEGLSSLTKLKRITFGGELYGDFVNTLSQPLPNLTSLLVRMDVDEYLLIHFMEPFLPSLEYLSFTGGYEDRKDIEKLILLAPRLKEIYICCDDLTNADILELRRKYAGRIEVKTPCDHEIDHPELYHDSDEEQGGEQNNETKEE
eukprot:TRINITY_DN916_c0_g2_i4.p1 TRINITY_DN916_c0_g2~~TRINITY_DN916_c0_g2_i4.p1  ORF type:complete len:463 (-),score=90.87 TRINITY_DN916_c0_g2_i4:100-1488(-)